MATTVAVTTRCAGLALVLASCLAAQPAAFEGTATNAVTHEPLSGVHVRLMGLGNLPQGPFDTYGAMSDRAGHFSIAALAPGTYLLSAQYRGFVYAQPKQGALPFPTVSLKAGQRLIDFKLEMAPAAVITGRVLDEYGDPMARVEISAEPVSSDFVVASNDLFSGHSFNQTDDRGMFRISGLPGKYYLKASAAGDRSGPVEIRTDGTTPPEYVPTWFPDATGKDGAVVVEARAASVASGFDIRLARAVRQRTLSISGVVTGVSQDGGYGFVQVMQLAGDSQRVTGSQGGASFGSDGKFTIPRLEPGSYRLAAVYATAGGGMPQQGPSRDVKLDSADVTNVELHLTGGGDLSGTLEIAGEPRGAPTEKRTVRLEVVGMFGFGSAPTGAVDADGAFHLERLPAGRFRVKVDPMPENAFLKTVQLDGEVAADGILDLHGTPGAHVKITVSRNGARLSGTVRNGDGDPLVGALAVVLLADDVEKLDLNADAAHTARVTGQGKYSFGGVRPGKYRLLALDPLQSPDIGDPDKLKKMAAAAEEIEVKEGDRISRDLKVVEKEAGDAKAKR